MSRLLFPWLQCFSVSLLTKKKIMVRMDIQHKEKTQGYELGLNI